LAQEQSASVSLLAGLAARGVLERYFSCIDRRDWTGLAECFAEDARAAYNPGGVATILEGRAAIVERLRLVTRFAATNHLLSNAHVVVTGDHASADTNAIAHLVMGDTGRQRVLVRGLRYLDQLRQVDGLWQIHQRTHEQLWQFEADAVPPRY
jgi:hypothetical protein